MGKTFTKNYEMLQNVFHYFMNCMMTNKWDRGFKGCPTLIIHIQDSLQTQLTMIPLNEFKLSLEQVDDKQHRKRQMTVDYK